MRREHGQSTVEFVALLPVIVVIALACGQLLAVGAAREAAAGAAQAAAMAELQGGEAVAAARAAAPGWARKRMTVKIVGRRVTVTVAPRQVLPGLAAPLTAKAHADAGPRP
ncbi:MAG TPA: hypothetical protein VNT22_00565 [Baekduia sp.]|nr:hypothetical protein [Baekduia sp.]